VQSDSSPRSGSGNLHQSEAQAAAGVRKLLVVGFRL
jgi:hypothetical protein